MARQALLCAHKYEASCPRDVRPPGVRPAIRLLRVLWCLVRLDRKRESSSSAERLLARDGANRIRDGCAGSYPSHFNQVAQRLPLCKSGHARHFDVDGDGSVA